MFLSCIAFPYIICFNLSIDSYIFMFSCIYGMVGNYNYIYLYFYDPFKVNKKRSQEGEEDRPGRGLCVT